MMVKLYVNWDSGIILNERQVEETVENEYYANATSYDSFSEWLSENYSPASLFDMNKDEKETIRADFMKEMKETAWNDFIADGYEEVSVEI